MSNILDITEQLLKLEDSIKDLAKAMSDQEKELSDLKAQLARDSKENQDRLIRIESGRQQINSYVDTPKGSKDCLYNDSRPFTVPIRFNQPFSSPPKVVVGISLFDVQGAGAPFISIIVRGRVDAEDVTAIGFNLKFATWAGSLVHGITSEWLAYGN